MRGATTGAGIRTVGAIGMAAGFGFHLHALVMTGFAVLVITVLEFVKPWLPTADAGAAVNPRGDRRA
jgi:uncharacterized membrane protein YhiD involved in acid resistance